MTHPYTQFMWIGSIISVSMSRLIILTVMDEQTFQIICLIRFEFVKS